MGKAILCLYTAHKSLHLKTKEGNVLGLHLMLHGRLTIADSKEQVKYAILGLQLDDGNTFTLTDFPVMATHTLNPDEVSVPDALDKQINAQFLQAAFEGKKTSVKNILLDQHVIRGIGNAYADEILYDAGISPLSVAAKIPKPQLTKLASSIRKVLKDAIKKISKANPDIISGEIRDFLDIHNPKKDEAPDGS